MKTSMVGAALVTVGKKALAGCAALGMQEEQLPLDKQSQSNAPELKISFQEGTAPGDSLREKFDYMEQHGLVGFEPGGRGLLQRVPQLKEELK